MRLVDPLESHAVYVLYGDFGLSTLYFFGYPVVCILQGIWDYVRCTFLHSPFLFSNVILVPHADVGHVFYHVNSRVFSSFKVLPKMSTSGLLHSKELISP